MPRHFSCHTAAAAVGVLLLCILPRSAAAAPRIDDLSLRGLQAGGTTTLVVSGTQLQGEPRVVLAVPIAAQTVKPGGSNTRVEIEITLAADVSPGIYQLRVASALGVSNAVPVGVDAMPQQPFADRIESLPVALHGALTGGAVLTTRFAGKAGQRVAVDVEAQRLGAALNPVLELKRPDGTPLAYSQREPALGGDSRIDVRLPADGDYTIQLHDALYRGAAPGFFRLKVGAFHYADLVFPLGVRRGTSGPLDYLAAQLPEASHGEARPQGALDLQPAPWPPGSLASGRRPWLLASDVEEVVEAPPAAEQLQEVAAPAGINGRLGAPGEVDRYRVRVKPGTKLRIDVLAHRAGAPVDGVLNVSRAGGGGLANNDDRTGTVDPGLDVTVPGGVDAVVLALQDRAGRGGPDCIYRIDVRPVAPDFSLTLTADRYQVPRGGAALLRVKANRAGYNGPIALSLAGEPPAGLTLSNNSIPPGVNEALVSIQAADLQPACWLTRLVGTAAEGPAGRPRLALLAETPLTRQHPWFRSSLAVAVMRRSPIQVAWERTPADAGLTQGTTQQGTVRVTRAGKAQGAVRLSLATSQVVPQIADGKDKGKPDTAKALRLESAVTIPADADSAAVKIVVPPELPLVPYDLAIRAELLSPDGKRVVAAAVTPAERFLPVKKEPAAKEPAAEKPGNAKAGQS